MNIYTSRFYEQRFRFSCEQGHIVICDIPAEDRTLPNGYVQHLFSSDGHWAYSDPNPIVCPQCGIAMQPKIFRVRAKVTNKPCGDDCLCARGEDCRCSCGGANHGMKYLLRLSQHGGM